VYRRAFASGTNVTFDTVAKRGAIHFAGPLPPPTPLPTPPPTPPTPPTPPPTPGDCSSVLPNTGISGGDVTPGWSPGHPSPLLTFNHSACCQHCWAQADCVEWTWYTGGNGSAANECHLHNGGKKNANDKHRISGVVR
jgi:hypothetical protein